MNKNPQMSDPASTGGMAPVKQTRVSSNQDLLKRYLGWGMSALARTNNDVGRARAALAHHVKRQSPDFQNQVLQAFDEQTLPQIRADQRSVPSTSSLALPPATGAFATNSSSPTLSSTSGVGNGQFFGEEAKPPTITDLNSPGENYFDGRDTPPTLNTDPQIGVRLEVPNWQVALKNLVVGLKFQAVKPTDLWAKGNETKTPAEIMAEREADIQEARKAREAKLNPDMARIDAAREVLAELLANRPELAEQAKLSMPSEAQLGAAGLAALLQPNRAFSSLATPFRFQQEEQARQQQLNNQQFASDQQEWALMWQRATGDLNNEISMETNRQKNVLGAIESLDRLTSDIYAQDANTERTRMTVEGRSQVAGMNNETQIAKTLIQVQGMMSREEFKSPEAVANRVYQSEVAKGTPPELATEIALAAIRSDFYKNEQARAATLERLTLLPIKVQQGVANIAKTQADIDYIAARSEYTRSLAQATTDDYALALLKHGLEVDKFNRSKETADAQATLKAAEALLGAQQARAKVLGDQLKAAEQAFTQAEDTPREAEAKALVDRLREELATTNKDIMAAAKAIEGLGLPAPKFSLGGLTPSGDYVTGMFGNTVNLGGAAASGGRFRPEQVKAATQNVVCRSGAQCAEGLTQALQNLGFDIPTMLGAEQTARWALNNGGRVVTDPQPGDIVWVRGPGYGGGQANGRPSGHHVELYAGNGMVWNRRNGRWTNDKVSRHTNGRVTYIRLPK